MKKLCALFSLCALCVLPLAAAQPYAALVGVDSNNIIIPPNGAASIAMVASNAAQALAVSQAAAAASIAAADVSNRLTAVEDQIASQQQHAIFRGFVLSFTSAVEPVTNCAVQILKFTRRQQGTNAVADVFTWFEVAPTNTPTVSYRSRLNTTNAWVYFAALSNSWPATAAVTTTGGVFQCYQTSLIIPPAYTSAFFRANGNVQFVTGDADVLNVTGGLSVNGLRGWTGTRVVGAITNHFVGGVLVP
ncbi:MAG: hypothetical protein WCR06_10485 [bacterium]